jgi:hypothetical protein
MRASRFTAWHVGQSAFMLRQSHDGCQEHQQRLPTLQGNPDAAIGERNRSFGEGFDRIPGTNKIIRKT